MWLQLLLAEKSIINITLKTHSSDTHPKPKSRGGRKLTILCNVEKKSSNSTQAMSS